MHADICASAVQKPAPQSAKAPSTTTVEPEVISDEDRAILVKLVGESVTKDLIELDENIQTRKWNLLKGKTVPFPINDDRDVRRTIHQVCLASCCTCPWQSN